MLRNKIIYVFLWICIAFISCDDFLITPPLDKLSDEVWWKNKSQVEMMVNSCYAELYTWDELVFLDCITDNAKYREGDLQQVANGTYNTQNGFVSNKWKYGSVARLNYVLEGLEKARDYITGNEYRQYKAQVRFIRAFIYYDLIFYFGDVPLVTKVVTVSESRGISRSPRTEVLSFILSELEGDILSDIEAIPVTESGRVNINVVNAYLARIYLHEKNYDKVLTYTNAVINTGKYKLYSNYEALFRPKADVDANNKEVIFERQYSFPLYVNELNRNLSPASSVYAGWSRATPLQSMVDEYECVNGHSFHDCEALGCEYVQKRKDAESATRRGEYQFRDPRLAATIIFPFWEWKVNGVVQSVYGVDDPKSKDYLKSGTHQSGFLLTKWVDLEGENVDRTRAHKNMTIIRYADVLLMKAEALIEKSQDLPTAAQLINDIRVRAGMPGNIATTSQNDLRMALRHERRIELAFEGLRYYDIIRWRIAETVKPGKAMGARLKAVSDNMDNKFMEDRFWDNKMYLFPVPQSARDVNPNLTQNDGWGK